jgi:hypothetical protein
MTSGIRNCGFIQVCLSGLLFFAGCSTMSNTISSPDGMIKVQFQMDPDGRPLYAVACAGKQVLRPSAMGLVRSDSSFAEGLTLVKASPVGTSAMTRSPDSFSKPRKRASA